MSRSRRSFKVAVAGGLVIAAVAGDFLAGAAWATFRSSASSTGTAVATKRIFSTTRVTPAWTLGDASSGTSEVDASDPLSTATDGRTVTTGAWASSFSASRYVEFDYTAPLPAGLAASAMTFNFTFGSSTTGTTCFYFELRRRSTGTVLATHGSSGATLGCTTTTMSTVSTPLPEVTTTDVADDLRVRVFATNTGSSAAKVDQATVPVSMPYSSATLRPVTMGDSSTGTLTGTTRWSLATAGDGSVFTPGSKWGTSYVAGKYLRFTFPSLLPSGATVTAATFSHTYKDSSNGTVCYAMEVLAGGTQIGVHGNVTPYCNATTAFVTDTIDLPEVTTGALANGVVVKMYLWDSGSTKQSQHDQVSLSLTYYFN